MFGVLFEHHSSISADPQLVPHPPAVFHWKGNANNGKLGECGKQGSMSVKDEFALPRRYKITCQSLDVLGVLLKPSGVEHERPSLMGNWML